MIVRNVITRAPVTVAQDDDVTKAAWLMKEEDVGSVVVLEEGSVVGILTDRDIVMRAAVLADHTPVREVMTLMPVCLDGNADIEEALEKMEQYGVRRLPVLDTGGKLIGVVSLDDILMHLSRVLGRAGTLIRAEVLGLV
jgi:CBS domain-containing protein